MNIEKRPMDTENSFGKRRGHLIKRKPYTYIEQNLAEKRTQEGEKAMDEKSLVHR
jgi:hypothetical protein